jgi:hypothetical protein
MLVTGMDDVITLRLTPKHDDVCLEITLKTNNL